MELNSKKVCWMCVQNQAEREKCLMEAWEDRIIFEEYVCEMCVYIPIIDEYLRLEKAIGEVH